MKRSGFTLMEVAVAITVTGLIAGLAWGAMQAGFDTRDRIGGTREGVEAEMVARSLLARALRHAAPGLLGGEPVFVLRDGPTDELRFHTRGIVEPLGASDEWVVTLTATPEGLRFAGTSVAAGGGSFSSLLRRVRSLDVRVRGRDPRDGWLASWPVPDRSPVAVSIDFRDAQGRSLGVPLVARVGLEGNP